MKVIYHSYKHLNKVVSTDFKLTCWYVRKLLTLWLYDMLIEAEPLLTKCFNGHFDITQYSSSLDCINLPPFPHWTDFSNKETMTQYTTD